MKMLQHLLVVSLFVATISHANDVVKPIDPENPSCAQTVFFAKAPGIIGSIKELWSVFSGLVFQGTLDGHPIASSVRGFGGVGRHWAKKYAELKADYRATAAKSGEKWAQSVENADASWTDIGEGWAESVKDTRDWRDTTVQTNAKERETLFAKREKQVTENFATNQRTATQTASENRQHLLDFYNEVGSSIGESYAARNTTIGQQYTDFAAERRKVTTAYQREVWRSFTDPERVTKRDDKYARRLAEEKDRYEAWNQEQYLLLNTAILTLNQDSGQRESDRRTQQDIEWKRLSDAHEFDGRAWAMGKLKWVAHNWKEIKEIFHSQQLAALKSRQMGLAALQMDKTYGRFPGTSAVALRSVQATGQLVVLGFGGGTLAALGNIGGYPAVYCLSATRYLVATGWAGGWVIAYGAPVRKWNDARDFYDEVAMFTHHNVSWWSNAGISAIASAHRRLAYVGSMMANGLQLTTGTSFNYASAAFLKALNGGIYSIENAHNLLGSELMQTGNEALYLGGNAANETLAVAWHAANNVLYGAGRTIQYGGFGASYTGNAIIYGGASVAATGIGAVGVGHQVLDNNIRRLGRWAGALKRRIGLQARNAVRLADSFVVTVANAFTTPLFTAATLGWTVLDQTVSGAVSAVERYKYPAVRFERPLGLEVKKGLFSRVTVAADLLEIELGQSYQVARTGDEYGTTLTLADKQDGREVGRVHVITHRRQIMLRFEIQHWYVQTLPATNKTEQIEAMASLLSVLTANIDGPTVELARLNGILKKHYRVQPVAAGMWGSLLYPLEGEDAPALGEIVVEDRDGVIVLSTRMDTQLLSEQLGVPVEAIRVPEFAQFEDGEGI